MFNIGDIVEYSGLVPYKYGEYKKELIIKNLKKGCLYTICCLDNIWCRLEEDPCKWWYPQECFMISKLCIKKTYNLK